jgi:hypothetical protein
MRELMLFRLSALGIVLSIAACSEPGSAPDAVESELRQVSTPPADYVTTPAGLYHRSCVHEVAPGAVIERGGVVRRPDRTTYRVPDCAYPVIGGRAARSAVPDPWPIRAPSPTNSGWIEQATVNTNSAWSRITANWNVPLVPLAPYTASNQTYFAFPGILNSSFIIQPVIQFGVSAAGGGSYWAMASWRCGPPGGPCFHSSLKVISAGDVIHGDVKATNCSAGTCTWTIISQDLTNGQQASLSASDVQAYSQAVGGAVEVYGLTSCDQYPINGVSYSAIALYGSSGNTVVPSWSGGIQPSLNPFCGFNVSSAATTISLAHNIPTTSVRATGVGLTASTSCGLCTTPAVINSVTASGSVITFRDNGGHTGTINLNGATATGGLTASLPFCLCAQPPAVIRSIVASNHTITLTDNGGHTGTITVTGTALNSLSGGLIASRPYCACSQPPAAIVATSAAGTNGFNLADNGGNRGYIKFN